MAKAKYTYDEKRQEWSTKIWDGTYNADGSKHRKKIYSKKSSRDLEEKVADFKRQVAERGTMHYTNMTFGEYAEHWLKSTKAGIREKNTVAMYQNVIRVHLQRISFLPVDRIQHSHFLEVINAASDRPRTCEQIFVTFRQIMRMAVQDRLVTQNDFEMICSNISLPKRQKREKRPLTLSEKYAIKNATFTDREKFFVHVLYSCGLRREEILALTPADFDLAQKTISVNKVVIFDGNAPEIKNTPKTDRGLRKVPFPAMDEYRDLVLRSKQYVFGRDDGGLLTLSGYNAMFGRILLKINTAAGGKNAYNPRKKKSEIVENRVPGLTAHIFRHNFCTELCYQIPKISIKKIAQLMGDTEKVVLDVYNHIVDEKEDPTAVIAENFAI